MRNGNHHKKNTFVITTSWDDGHPLDIRVAELLNKYGFRGSFYIPVQYDDRQVMKQDEIRYLVDMGMEVGSHTYSHPTLTELPPKKVMEELVRSKTYLEDILGKEVISFCYPKGKFNDAVLSSVKEAGYHLARTTIAFRTNLSFDPFCMPVSFQLFPHRKVTHVKHALKENNLKGLLAYALRFHLRADLHELSVSISNHIQEHSGVLHLWGHSWEIEQAGLWSLLEDILYSLSEKPDVSYCTNGEVLKYL